MDFVASPVVSSVRVGCTHKAVKEECKAKWALPTKILKSSKRLDEAPGVSLEGVVSWDRLVKNIHNVIGIQLTVLTSFCFERS